MSQRNRQQWERLGRIDPYWAVLTDPSTRNGRWDREQFFRSGREEVSVVLAQLEKLGCLPASRINALDFGCGVGRLSQALAESFQQVLAMDVAHSMLQEARAANHRDNIRFVHNADPGLDLVASHSMDFVYSNITLQHIIATDQARYLQAFCRVLAPGGALVFQTPSHHASNLSGRVSRLLGNRLMNGLRALRYGVGRVMEMHVLPRSRVESILDSGGLYLAQTQRYDAAGKAFVSYRYFAASRSRRDES